jgi:hypothetical protein
MRVAGEAEKFLPIQVWRESAFRGNWLTKRCRVAIDYRFDDLLFQMHSQISSNELGRGHGWAVRATAQQEIVSDARER